MTGLLGQKISSSTAILTENIRAITFKMESIDDHYAP